MVWQMKTHRTSISSETVQTENIGPQAAAKFRVYSIYFNLSFEKLL
jgi:hypothetical protein